MKKSVIALLIVVTIVFSGFAGFGGTYLANSLNGNSIPGNGSSDGSRVFRERAPSSPYIPEILTPSDRDPLDSDALTIPEIVELVADSVVEVYTEYIVSGGRPGQYITEGAGSGVIVTTSGYIVTNNHVIEDAQRISVRLTDGSEYDATLIGRDSRNDIAVIKINASNLTIATIGDSDGLVVGELAVAIGNPLGELGGTVSEGIISALSRSIYIEGETMILLQTTAAINPGNSGGGLFNSYGELIGVVNAKSSGTDIEGLGFAIPINSVTSIIENLIEFGYIPGRIDFGATLIDILDSYTAMQYRVSVLGVYILSADPGSNLRTGDLIISIDGTTIDSSVDVMGVMDRHKVGDVVTFTVSRNGSTTTVSVTLKQAYS